MFGLVSISVCVALGTLTGCTKKETKKTAKLAYVNWEEGVDYTHLAKAVLEEKMGYKVELTAADVAPAYVSVAQGDQDAFMETWLPVTHEDYIKKYQDDLVQLGIVYKNTKLGLVVPRYMYDAGVKNISDLLRPDVEKKLNSTIIGIDSGAGIMRTTEQKIMPQYGLNKAGYKLLASSGPAMVSALKEAIGSKEWIVVTGWQPHSMFGYFDLAFLSEDKKPVIWDPGNIYIYGRKNIKKDKPELAEFLSKMNLTSDQMASLMVAIKDSSKDTLNAASDWMHSHEDIVNAWLPKSE